MSALCNAEAGGGKHRGCLADLSLDVWHQCGGQAGGSVAELLRERPLDSDSSEPDSQRCFYLCDLRQLIGPSRASAAKWVAARTIERVAVSSAMGRLLAGPGGGYTT